MGFGDPGSALAELIAKVVTSPRVQYIGKSLGRVAPQAAQPLRFNSPSIGGTPTGASPRSNGSAGNFGQIAGSIASALSSLTHPQQQQQQDPLMDLYNQLLNQLQTPVQQPKGIDTEALMQQVQAAINPIYDQREATAKTNTGQATKQVQGMYGALAQDYEKLAPQQIAQANEAKQQIEQMYGQLRTNIEGSYSRVSKEQGDLFKSLGIEAALPDVLNKQQAPVQDASIAASENQAQQEQRYMDMGQADATYYREGSPIAKMTGNEISTDMLSKLQDYLNQTEAERTSGIQTGYMDQLGQAQSQLAQQQQAAAQQTSSNQDKLWQMLQGQLNAKQQPLTIDSFMSSLPQNVQQSVAGAFTSLQRSPEAVYGKVEDKRSPVPGTYVATTPQWYMQQADKMFQEGQIDAATHQALLMYLQLNFKSGQ
jgi:hypothetical protein